MTGPFRTPRLHVAQTVGPFELLDIIADAEAAELTAKVARQRANAIIGLFSTQRGYRMHLTAPEARRLATIEADCLTTQRRRRA